MPELKRQHYVPQLYLRYFSNDGKSLRVYSISEERIVSNEGPISRQCYKDHMYSDDLTFEKKLSDIENITKSIFDKIILTNRVLARDSSEYQALLTYLLFQESRTLCAADNLNEATDKMTKSLLKDYIEVSKPEEISIDDLNGISILYEQPGLYNLNIISQLVPLILDLECKLVINNTKLNFISSDNPVILYNKYFLNNPLSFTGLANKGLTIFFPVNPKILIILYDSVLYQFGGKKYSSNVIVTKENDITELNMLQFINAYKTIYPYQTDEILLNSLCRKAKRFRNKTRSIISDTIEKSDNKSSLKIEMSKAKILYDINLSFLKINKNIPIDYKRQGNVRSMELINLHKEYCDKIDRKEIEASDWSTFLSRRV